MQQLTTFTRNYATVKKHTVVLRSDAVATNFFISLEQTATIPGWRLLEGGVNKLQLGNTYKINTHHDCRTTATWM